MRRWLAPIASLKLSVVLLIVLGVVLAAATVKESTQGTEAAQAVYYSPWFFAIQGLFALNVVASLLDRWPRNRWRVGFAVTHVSMLLILCGGAVTYFGKTEGRIALWEGDATNRIVEQDAHGGLIQHPLPFSIRLDGFEIDTYPGTGRPAMFRSRVTVLDAGRGEQAAVIQMNAPLHYGGWSFFQSSYQQDQGREMSILAVARDPGQPIVFLGYTFLVAGMIVVFFTRLAQQRRLREVATLEAELAAKRAGGQVTPARAVAATLAALVLAGLPLSASQVPDAAKLAALRAVPVQYDGREMPLDTQARDDVRTVTGLRAWPGIDPVAMVVGWSLDPEGWSNQPIVRLGDAEVARVAGLSPTTKWAPFAALAQSEPLIAAIRAVHDRQAQQEEVKLTATERHLQALEERLMILDGYFRGNAIRAVPQPERGDAWIALDPSRGIDLVDTELQLRANPQTPAHYPPPTAIARELRYNATQPTRLAWILMLVGAVAAVATANADRWRLRLVGAAALTAGFAASTWGIALRWQIAGRIPASNMYESMLFLSWGVGLFAILALALRQRQLLVNAALMGALAATLVDLLPMDPFIHPMPPVLSGTPWLAIHVPIIMVSYSVLAIGTMMAHLVVGAAIFAPGRRDLAARWSEMLYLYLHVGSILLITGILTGSIWAASSWGRYWGWDPKEVWSLVAFLAYMAILHAKFDRQIRDFGVALSAIAAFWTILMTYLGVNFVLAAGLHSYGFGSSNLVLIMGLVLAAEGVFLGAGWLAFRRGSNLRMAAVTAPSNA